MNAKTKGILWFAAQCVTMPVTMGLVRLAAAHDEITVIILIQNFVSFLILGGIMLAQKVSPRTQKFKVHFIRNMFGLASWCSFFYAFTHMPLNTATAITFTGPLVTTILAAILIKERIHGHRLIGLVAGFCGMLVLLNPKVGALNEWGVLNFFGVIFVSFTIIFFHILNRTEKVIVIVFYMAFLSMLMIAPVAIIRWQTPTPQGFALAALIGTFAVFNIFALVSAVKHAGIGTLMPFDFLRLIVTALLAYFVFGEKLNEYTVIGSVIIISSVIYVMRRERSATAK